MPRKKNKSREQDRMAVERRQAIFSEGMAILLAGITAYLAIAILSFNSQDPSFNTTGEGDVTNLGGLVGAYLADLLLQLFGYSSAWIPIFFGLSAYLNMRRTPSRLRWEQLATLPMLAVVTTIASVMFQGPDETSAMPAGPGGLAGMMATKALVQSLGRWGAILLLLTLGLLSLLVLTRFSIFSIALWFYEKTAAIARALLPRPREEQPQDHYVPQHDGIITPNHDASGYYNGGVVKTTALHFNDKNTQDINYTRVNFVPAQDAVDFPPPDTAASSPAATPISRDEDDFALQTRMDRDVPDCNSDDIRPSHDRDDDFDHQPQSDQDLPGAIRTHTQLSQSDDDFAPGVRHDKDTPDFYLGSVRPTREETEFYSTNQPTQDPDDFASGAALPQKSTGIRFRDHLAQETLGSRFRDTPPKDTTPSDFRSGFREPSPGVIGDSHTEEPADNQPKDPSETSFEGSPEGSPASLAKQASPLTRPLTWVAEKVRAFRRRSEEKVEQPEWLAPMSQDHEPTPTPERREPDLDDDLVIPVADSRDVTDPGSIEEPLVVEDDRSPPSQDPNETGSSVPPSPLSDASTFHSPPDDLDIEPPVAPEPVHGSVSLVAEPLKLQESSLPVAEEPHEHPVTANTEPSVNPGAVRESGSWIMEAVKCQTSPLPVGSVTTANAGFRREPSLDTFPRGSNLADLPQPDLTPFSSSKPTFIAPSQSNGDDRFEDQENLEDADGEDNQESDFDLPVRATAMSPTDDSVKRANDPDSGFFPGPGDDEEFDDDDNKVPLPVSLPTNQQSLEKAGPAPVATAPLPPMDLLEKTTAGPGEINREYLTQQARLLELKLADFKIKGQIINVIPGPVVTTFEFDPAPGLRASKVISVSDDLARSILSPSVRVVGNIPGKNVIGVEVPNQTRSTVYLREILESEQFTRTGHPLAVALGSDITGNPVVANLAKMPHLLVAGTTGSGKSVAVNAMICSILFSARPDQVRFIMVDPKMLELSIYEGIPHLLAPVVTDVHKAANLLKWAVMEMEERYRLMSEMGVRSLDSFNRRMLQCVETGERPTRRVKVGFDPETGAPVEQEEPIPLVPKPLIVIVIDELADLMIQVGKEVEPAIARLAQMARAAGLHLIIATQRPSVDVITGLIKANFPTRLAFQVSSKIDSRTILDAMGAERLLGMGDGLYLPPGTSHLKRIHAPLVTDSEVHKLVGFLKKTAGSPKYDTTVMQHARGDDSDGDFGPGGFGGGMGDTEPAEEYDPLYDQAVALVVRARKVSTSMVQRHFKIGYNRAARIVERMEADGLVTPSNSAGKREVLTPNHQEE